MMHNEIVWNMMQLWSSMKYAFRQISWGKCAWRLRDFLHYNYIAIEFCSCFPFFGSIFLHFLRIQADFYRTTTFWCCIFFKSSTLQSSFPIYWVHFPIYQVRSTSLDFDFHRLPNTNDVFLTRSTKNFTPILGVLIAWPTFSDAYGGIAYVQFFAYVRRIVSWSITMP